MNLFVGDISAMISFHRTKLDFGGTITCYPNKLYLKPNDCGTFILEFTTKQQGRFMEEVLFRIVNSNEFLKIYMKYDSIFISKNQYGKINKIPNLFLYRGSVICPLLSFDIPELDFGFVAYGWY